MIDFCTFYISLTLYPSTSLDDLEQFIEYAVKELSVDLQEDDYDGLLKVMGVLNEVKLKVDAGTDLMFEPLRDIMDVLKEYGVEFPEETYEQVRDIWFSLKKAKYMFDYIYIGL